MREGATPHSQPVVGDPISRREARVIGRSLRASGLIEPTERLVSCRPEPVTCYWHPSAGSTAHAPDLQDASAEGGIVGIDASIPPHLWLPRSLTDLRRAAEESFVSLEHAQGTSRAIAFLDAQRRTAQTSQSEIFRVGGGGTDGFASPQHASGGVPAPGEMPPGIAHIIGVGERGLLSSAECRVHRGSALAGFLDHVNGHSLRETSAAGDRPFAGGGAGEFHRGGPSVARRTNDAVAVDCRLLAFEKHVVLAIPVPGWLSDESFVGMYEAGVDAAAHIIASRGKSFIAASSRQQKRLPKNVARLVDDPDDAIHGYQLGGSAHHQGFDAADPWAPTAYLCNSAAEACRAALESLREVDDAPWTTRRQNPFASVPTFPWEPRRFIVRVLPLAHTKTARALPRQWWSDMTRLDPRRSQSSSLQRAMLALAAQIDAHSAAAARLRDRVEAEHGLSFVRGGAGGASFGTFHEEGEGDDSTTLFSDVKRSHSAAEQKEIETASETAILWGGSDGSASAESDASKLLTFVLKSFWGTHDRLIMNAIDRDRSRFLQRLRQIIKRASGEDQRAAQERFTGFRSRSSTGGSAAAASPGRGGDGGGDAAIDVAVLDDLSLSTRTHHQLQHSHPVIAMSDVRPGSLGVVDDGDIGDGQLADHDVYVVSDAFAALAHSADEHRLLAALFNVRTLLNPEVSLPPIQQLAAGAARDVDGYESVQRQLCAYHYEVEVLPVFSKTPSHEAILNASTDRLASKLYDEGRAGRVVQTFEHVLLVQTRNLLAVCKRTLTQSNYGSDAAYRANALSTVASAVGAVGARMCLDHSSILSMTIAGQASTASVDRSGVSQSQATSGGGGVVSRRPALDATRETGTYKVTVVYSGTPLLTDRGTPGPFDPLADGATLERHTFFVAGSAALAEAKAVQAAWLEYSGAAAGCDAKLADLRAAFRSFLAVSSPAQAETPQGAMAEAHAVAVDLQTYARDRLAYDEAQLRLSKRLAKQSGGGRVDPRAVAAEIGQPPRPPPPRLSNAFRCGFITRKSLRFALDVAIPSDPAAASVFGAIVLSSAATSTSRTQTPPARRLVPFQAWLKVYTVFMAGTRRLRHEFLMAAITHATPPDRDGLFHKEQLASFLAHTSGSGAKLAEELWAAIPSFRLEWAPADELALQLEEIGRDPAAAVSPLRGDPLSVHHGSSSSLVFGGGNDRGRSPPKGHSTTAAVGRVANLGLMSLSTTPLWHQAVFLGSPLWPAACRLAVAVSVIHHRWLHEAAEGRPNPKADPPGSPSGAGRVHVKPEWRESVPWLQGETSIPEKTHVYLERKYQQQRIFSLDSGALLDEVWSTRLAVRPELGASFIEIVPDVTASLRDMAGVTTHELHKSLGIGRLTAGILGGSFVGLRRPRTPYSNVSLANALAGYRPGVNDTGAAQPQQPPKAISNVYETHDGQFLVQFLDAAGIHNLLTILPKYHRYVYDHRDASLLPRYVGMFGLCFAQDGGTGNTGEPKLVFVTVMVSPTAKLARDQANRMSARVPDVATHVCGNVRDGYHDSPRRGVGVWSVDTATLSTVGQSSCVKFDVSDELQRPLVAGLKRDGEFLAKHCGVTHFSVGLYFYRNQPGSSAAAHAGGDASGSDHHTSTLARSRTWLAARRRALFLHGVRGYRQLSTARRREDHSAPSEHPAGRFPREGAGTSSAHDRADVRPSYLRNLSLVSAGATNRPLVRYSAGVVSHSPAGFAPDDDDDDDAGVGYLTGAPSRHSDPSASAWPESVPLPTVSSRRVKVELAAPATWTCVVCNTVNQRHRNAAMVKPCHVCFGLNERLAGGKSIPVTTSAKEYTALVAAAEGRTLDDERSVSPDRQPGPHHRNRDSRRNHDLRRDGPNVFGIEPEEDVLQAPVGRSMRRLKGEGVDAVYDDDDDFAHDLERSASPRAADRSQSPPHSADRRRPPPGASRVLTRGKYDSGTRGELDTFLRLAGAPTRKQRLLDRSADFIAPGTACVPATVEGREDVAGHLLVFVCDALGLPGAPATATADEGGAYATSLHANVLDAFGDDFL